MGFVGFWGSGDELGFRAWRVWGQESKGVESEVNVKSLQTQVKN